MYIFKWNSTLCRVPFKFSKNLSGKICIELDIANVKFYLNFQKKFKLQNMHRN